ncbi:MAG: diacylglycerol kinase family protein [Desulfuromonadaceae bacterium]|nr:diacylglycerol kinase family protein [Desulfuromonadaceae bacterium]MDD2854300.1 diacylglycerol kinase family protein [Desulfuromonadaceae bacterium]
MNSRNSYLFVNPLSGHYSSRRFASLLNGLCNIGVDPKVFQVRTPTEIFEYCKEINEDDQPRLVLVAGGDGTFNAVVNGLNSDTRITLAVLPLGTSNVLAAEIGIKSVDEAIERIAIGRNKPLTLGTIEFEGRNLRFVLMAGIGLDGRVVRDVWTIAKRFLKQGAYGLSALKNVLLWEHNKFELSSKETDLLCHTAIVCNASRYGGDFILSPECNPFESGLSAVCITSSKRLAYINSLFELMIYRIKNCRNLTRLSGVYFKISGRYPIQIDGDFVGYSPAVISEHPFFANIIV